MNNIDQFPKAIKKAVRFIKQDASTEQLEEIKRIIEYAVQRRKSTLKKSS